MILRVSVAVALPERQEVIEVSLPEGSTVEDALRAALIEERFPGLGAPGAEWAIWSRPVPRTAALRDGDRVEALRALRADAKDRRRARARLNPSSKRSRSAP